jgi:hypothetical protein
MDETQRYREPKLIGDILRDMKMDTASIGRKIKLHELSKQFSQESLAVLEQYMTVMETKHPMYNEASAILQDIDAFYAETKSWFQQAKLKLQKWQLSPNHIKENICSIEKVLTAFEIKYNDINGILRNTIRKIRDHNDKRGHTLKANAFCTLFTQIYHEIDAFCVEYGKMLRTRVR